VAFLKFSIVAWVIAGSATVAWAGVQVGDRMPVVSVADADGTAVDIDLENEGLVVIEFWATWCKLCERPLATLARLARERRPDEFRAIAVNIDRSRSAADSFLAEKLAADRDRLQVVYDPGGEAMARLGSSGLPALYVVEDGVVRMSQGGWAADGEERLEATVDMLLRRRAVRSAEPGSDISALTSQFVSSPSCRR
jgi:thiol-disulfide isomerase/thioredoxin